MKQGSRKSRRSLSARVLAATATRSLSDLRRGPSEAALSASDRMWPSSADADAGGCALGPDARHPCNLSSATHFDHEWNC